MKIEPQPVPGFGEFASQVNSPFFERSENNSDVEFLLVEATELYSDERTQSFSLLFRAPSTTAPVQRIFNLNNSHIGDLELFLVPVGQKENGILFEAAFNIVR